MRTGQRSAWRRRGRNSRAARIAVPLAIPMALGLTLGIVLAVSGSNSTKISPSALGASATPSASAMGTATASASPTASATATPAAAAAAAANVSCDIIVPANPLSAQGLATPYQLTGPNGMTPQASGCTMANFANLGAFVQATILDPATGQLSVYDPLVITQGTTAAAAPVVPTLPANAMVTIDFGFNGTNLTQVASNANNNGGRNRFRFGGGNSLQQGRCVNGLNGSIFGQVSFCNGVAFFQAVRFAEQRGLLKVPAIGTSAAGLPCPTTRSFNLVDQDQSDNVTTTYLLTANGQTAQDNTANQAALAGAQPINNGSDNLLLDKFVDPAIGCTPFQAASLSSPGTMESSQALDEILAGQQQAPIAEVPENDPMTLVGTAFSAAKTNLYRVEVGQSPIGTDTASDTSQAYCTNLVNSQPAFLMNEQTALQNFASLVPAVGNNLFTFEAARLSASFGLLNCQNFGLTNPVNLTLDGNGVAIAATLNTAQQTATTTGAAGNTNPAPANNANNGQNPGQVPGGGRHGMPFNRFGGRGR